jgi:hypothetical protein
MGSRPDLGIILGFPLERLKKITNISVMISDDPTDIRTESLPNTNVNSYS